MLLPFCVCHLSYASRRFQYSSLEFRRGADEACISALEWSKNGEWIGCGSDRRHLTQMEHNQNPNTPFKAQKSGVKFCASQPFSFTFLHAPLTHLRGSGGVENLHED
jgi:hypothetical protein